MTMQLEHHAAVISNAHRDYVKGLNLHAFYKLSDKAKSEDLVQDTFLKTWKYLVKGGKIDTMRAFLYHILNHLIIDQYRKQETISLEDLVEKGFEAGLDSTSKIISMLDGKKALFLIQRLPAKYQKVMRMRFVQELSFKEMALITGEQENTMAVQVHRGISKLKVLYTSKI